MTRLMLRLVDRIIEQLFIRQDFTAARPGIRRHDNHRSGVVDTRRYAVRGETTEHHRMDRPNARAGQQRNVRLGDHRHINQYPIATLYAQLARVAPSPVVELNRAVAVGKAFGAEAGLAIADALRDVPPLRGYAPLHAVRGDLLLQLGRNAEARAEFTRAAELTGNVRERDVLAARAAACG